MEVLDVSDVSFLSFSVGEMFGSNVSIFRVKFSMVRGDWGPVRISKLDGG